MRTIYFTVVLLMAIQLSGCNEHKSPVALQKEMLSETGKLEKSFQDLRDSIARSQSQDNISRQFKAARLQYKKVEWALEYFMPQILDQVPEIPQSQEMYLRPRNFGHLDSIVASGNLSENKALLLNEINSLLNNSKNFSAYLETIDLGNEAVSSNE